MTRLPSESHRPIPPKLSKMSLSVDLYLELWIHTVPNGNEPPSRKTPNAPGKLRRELARTWRSQVQCQIRRKPLPGP
jgi:hypothetical protein